MKPTNNNKKEIRFMDSESGKIRIEHIETAVESISDAVSSLTKIAAGTTANVDNLTSQVSKLSEDVKVISTKKFDWANLIAACFLLLAFWAASTKPLQNSIDELKLGYAGQQTILVERAKFMGRSEAMDELTNDRVHVLEEQMKHVMATRNTAQMASDNKREIFNKIDLIEQKLDSRILDLSDKVFNHQSANNNQHKD